MNGWILYGDSGQELKAERHEIERLLAAGQKRGIDLKVFAPEQFELVVTSHGQDRIYIDNKPIDLPDFFLPRMGSQTDYFGLAVIRELEQLGVCTINCARTVEIVKDKLITHQLLARNSIPIPKTMLVNFPVDVDLVEKVFGFPVVVKTISGTHGNGVYLSENKSKFLDLMGLVDGTLKGVNIILQEYIESSRGRDLRVFTVGGKVVACMERKARRNEFKANFSQGAEVLSHPITSEIEWLGIETSRLLDVEVGGIDLLFKDNKFLVCEANTSPGFRGIESCCDVDIPNAIYDYVEEKLNSSGEQRLRILGK